MATHTIVLNGLMQGCLIVVEDLGVLECVRLVLGYRIHVMCQVVSTAILLPILTRCEQIVRLGFEDGLGLREVLTWIATMFLAAKLRRFVFFLAR